MTSTRKSSMDQVRRTSTLAANRSYGCALTALVRIRALTSPLINSLAGRLLTKGSCVFFLPGVMGDRDIIIDTREASGSAPWTGDHGRASIDDDAHIPYSVSLSNPGSPSWCPSQQLLRPRPSKNDKGFDPFFCLLNMQQNYILLY